MLTRRIQENLQLQTSQGSLQILFPFLPLQKGGDLDLSEQEASSGPYHPPSLRMCPCTFCPHQQEWQRVGEAREQGGCRTVTPLGLGAAATLAGMGFSGRKDVHRFFTLSQKPAAGIAKCTRRPQGTDPK